MAVRPQSWHHGAMRARGRSHDMEARMNRNAVFAVIAVLVVAVGVLGYLYYQQHQREGRVEINLGKNGISIQKN